MISGLETAIFCKIKKIKESGGGVLRGAPHNRFRRLTLIL
jgi:hypothetical protein